MSTPQTFVDTPAGDSFTHLVQQGWETECVERLQETSDVCTGLAFGQSDIHRSLNSGFLLQQFGGDRYLEPQLGCSETDTGFDVEDGLYGLEQDFSEQNDPDKLLLEGVVDSGLNRSSQLSLDAGDDLRSQASILDDYEFDSRTDAGSIVSNISACVDAAYAMLPLEPPKPIWEQGVWADIFGDGVFMKSNWCAMRLHKSAFHSMPTVPDSESQPVTKKPRVRKASDSLQSYSDVVVHKSDVSWQEERESLMQNALKRWLVTASYFHPNTLIRIQLDSALQEIDKLTLLADVFRGRAPATLHKRVRSVEKMCAHFGVGHFPPGEHVLYEFIKDQRAAGATSSKLKGFMEALSFCRFVLSMEELTEATNSRRCAGATRSDVPRAINQAVALTVEELRRLHAKLQEGDPWDRIFAGSILFATYSRARWADLMHCDQVILDKDDQGTVRYIEGRNVLL